MPTSAVRGSAAMSVVPTCVQATPSGDSKPVTVEPARVSFSQRGAGPVEPLTSEVGLPLNPVSGRDHDCCIRDLGTAPGLSRLPCSARGE